ncbi:MAG: hypothetical protein RL326_1414 [Pseudomonadota bacterium]
MSFPPSPDPRQGPHENEARSDLEQEVTIRVTEFLLRRHGGFHEVHSSQLENAFESRARSIYGLDRYSFGGVDVQVSAMYECDDETVIALIHVRDDVGVELYPDLRKDVLFEYALHAEKAGIVLEPLESASQATLVAPDGDPRTAKLLPFFSDQAYQELDQHRSSAVLRLKAIRSVDSSSCYPVGEPSLLINMMLRAIRDELCQRFVGDPTQREVYTLPTAIRDIEQRETGIYDIRLARLHPEKNTTSITVPLTEEVHRVSLKFNRFFGKIERQYVGLQDKT